MREIPTGILLIESAAVNPPKPLGFHVVVDGRPIASLDYEKVKQMMAKYDAMVKAREYE